jgi:hypothetical protein
MSVISSLRKVSPGNLIKLVGLVLSRPLFAFPTLKATRECIAICDQYFGRKHMENGPANAFRHALWNILIARKCSRWTSNIDELLSWAERVTDWHEDTFPNPVSARIMDLHNNRIGRDIFRHNPGLELQEYIDLLLSMKGQAIHLTQLYIPETCTDCMVYLKETSKA